MARFEISGEKTCALCGEELVINCLPDVKSGLGVCDECGLPHKFTPEKPQSESVVLESAEPTFGSDYIDWEVIEAYYRATGNRAVTLGCCEHTEAQAEEFFDWANENFNMHWGKDPEEIDEL